MRVTTADETAIEGADYVALDQILTFAPNETSKAAVIDIVDEFNYEPAQTFSVNLSSPTGSAGIGTPATATVTINASDWPPFVYLADGGSYTATYAANETSGSIAVPVRLSEESAYEARVDYSTSDGTATSGVDLRIGLSHFWIGCLDQGATDL